MRADHLKKEPCCIACGRSRQVDVHHVVPVSVDPGRELDPENLVTLCSDPCHFVHGHLMNFRSWNSSVRADAEAYFEKLKSRP